MVKQSSYVPFHWKCMMPNKKRDFVKNLFLKDNITNTHLLWSTKKDLYKMYVLLYLTKSYGKNGPYKYGLN